jgi:hypothetical protein
MVFTSVSRDVGIVATANILTYVVVSDRQAAIKGVSLPCLRSGQSNPRLEIGEMALIWMGCGEAFAVPQRNRSPILHHDLTLVF